MVKMKTYKFTLDINSDDPGKRIANELETILGNAEMEVDVLYEASNDTPHDYYLRTEEQFCIDELGKHFELIPSVDPRNLTDSKAWVIIKNHGYWK